MDSWDLKNLGSFDPENVFHMAFADEFREQLGSRKWIAIALHWRFHRFPTMRF
jgi:hypothetical protein